MSPVLFSVRTPLSGAESFIAVETFFTRSGGKTSRSHDVSPHSLPATGVKTTRRSPTSEERRAAAELRARSCAHHRRDRRTSADDGSLPAMAHAAGDQRRKACRCQTLAARGATRGLASPSRGWQPPRSPRSTTRVRDPPHAGPRWNGCGLRATRGWSDERLAFKCGVASINCFADTIASS